MPFEEDFEAFFDFELALIVEELLFPSSSVSLAFLFDLLGEELLLDFFDLLEAEVEAEDEDVGAGAAGAKRSANSLGRSFLAIDGREDFEGI